MKIARVLIRVNLCYTYLKYKSGDGSMDNIKTRLKSDDAKSEITDVNTSYISKIQTIYSKDEQILVCLSSAPSNEQVIRTGARMAEAFHSGFIALYVETSDDELNIEKKQALLHNIKVAEDLGGFVVTVYGDDIPLQIAEYAKVSGVSKIIIGRTNNKKRIYSPRKNYVDRLMQLVPSVEIHIIPDNKPLYPEKHRSKGKRPTMSKIDLFKSIFILLGTSFIGWLFYKAGFSEANHITVYIIGVLFTSLWTNGKIYGVLASFIHVIVFNLFFTEPRFSLKAYDNGYPITFLIMLIASFITSSLAMRVKTGARQVAQKAYRTEVLLETSRKLQKADSTVAILEATSEQLRKLLNRTILFYAVDKEGILSVPQIFQEGDKIDMDEFINDKEAEVAKWVYRHNKRAGATTDVYSNAKCLYLSIRGIQNVSLGVVAIDMNNDSNIDAFVKNLMFAMLDESGLIIERYILNEAKKEVEMKANQEELRANLLRAISHDLRTPLTNISGSAGILMNNKVVLDESKKGELYAGIYDDSQWLINLVENLLSITRIDNGTMGLHMEPELLDEIFHEALLHLDRKASEHVISYSLSDDLLMAMMDSRLIVQVIINIVNNAIKYTGEGSTIKLYAEKIDENVVVSILDNGPGIKEEAKEKLFNMFYTVNKIHGDDRRGLGLGLSLCKSIIAAHGGIMGVKDNNPSGTIFYFTLLSTEVNTYE
jgi:two-component system sensor histidine kinase KdpD